MKRPILWLAAVLLLATLALPAAAEPAPTQIHTPEDLAAIAQDPSGSYILMTDLDMTGIAWTGLDFMGSFDGNGHAILNLTLANPGSIPYNSYDGNSNAYETTYYGLFASLKDATVQNLRLINVRALVDTQQPCFLAGIAGYMEHSTIENCEVSGHLELRAHERIYGVAGVAGYGCGTVKDCSADVTLICVDTDKQTRREQFLGGVYCTGFIDVTGCDIRLDGYISEHGYLHSGGICGMHFDYPWGIGKVGTMQDTHVAGKITFYEKNWDRRAYCDAFIGEPMIYPPFIVKSGLTHEFTRDEIWEYDTELRPEMCADPTYTQTVTAPGCNSFGFTTYVCDGCGYSYTDHYTLTQHTLTQWHTDLAPTVEAEGTEKAACDLCGLEFFRTVAKLYPPPPETEPPRTLPPETLPPAVEPEAPDMPVGLLLGLLALVAALIAALTLVIRKANRGGKYLKKK